MRALPVWSNDGFSIDNNDVWFVPYEINALCRYSIVERKVKEYYLSEDYTSREGSVYNVAILNSHIVAIPARSKNLIIVENSIKRECAISEDNQEKEKYRCCLQRKNELYIFPINEQYVIKYRFNQYEKIKFTHGSVASCALIGNDIYFTNDEGKIYKTDERFVNIVPLDIPGVTNICNVASFENIILLLTFSGEMFGLNIDNGNTYIANKLMQMDEDDYWSSCVYLNGKIALFPYKDHTRVWIYDCTAKSIGYVGIENDEYFNAGWEYNAFGQPVEENGKIYVFSPKHRAFLSIDLDGEIVERHHVYLKLDEDDMLAMLQKKFGVFPVICENQYQSLNTLLDYI